MSDVVAYVILGILIVGVACFLVGFPRPSRGSENKPTYLRVSSPREPTIEYSCIGGPWDGDVITVASKVRAILVIDDDRLESVLHGQYVRRHAADEARAMHWEPVSPSDAEETE